MATPPDVTVNYQHERIKCGKSNCRCNTEDKTKWHGPYWYAYWEDPKSGRTRSKYIGKNFRPPTTDPRTTHSESRPPPRPDEWSQDNRSGTSGSRQTKQEHGRQEQERERQEQERERQERARQEQERQRARASSQKKPTDEEDARCLGVDINVNADQLKKAWRRKMVAQHPDKFPEKDRRQQEEIAKNINAAYERMKKRRGW